MSKLYEFYIEDKKYLFDGNNMSIFEDSDTKLYTEKTQQENGILNETPDFLRSIVLNLTNLCNLKCDYCFANQGSYDNPGHVMSFEVAYKAVDLLMNSILAHNGESMTIGFFGGEPLLEFELIKMIVKYVEQMVPQHINTRYLITTNGLLFDSDKINFLKKHKFLVMLSVDGNQEKHDFHRKYSDGRGSYNDIVTILPELLESVPLTARITVTNDNNDILESVNSILALGIKRITFALDYEIDKKEFSFFIKSLEKLGAQYVKDIKSKNYYDLTNITQPMIPIVFKKKKRTHCNAGLSYLSVSAEGNLYRCPRFTGIKEFSLGQVTSIRERRIQESIVKFNDTLFGGAEDRSMQCNVCSFSGLCGGICYHHAYSINHSEFQSVSSECFYRKTIYKIMLTTICSLTLSERREFLLFLSDFWNRERG